MKRQILLLVGTFLAVLAVILLYQLFGPRLTDRMANDYVDTGSPDRPLGNRAVGEDPEVTGGERLWSEDRDEFTGRLRRTYYVRKWHKRDDGMYVLQDPRVTIYLKNGERVIIIADHGEVAAEEIVGRTVVQEGSLSDNVKMFIDRDTDEHRNDRNLDAIPLEQRENVIKIYMDDVKFSNANLEITSESKVRVMATEANITGTGLLLRWTEEPRQLQVLRIEHGERMEIFSLGGQGDPLSPPSASNTKLAKTSTAPAEAIATTSAPDADAKPDRLNEYTATFNAGARTVEAFNEDSRLTGADQLTVTFQFNSERSRKSLVDRQNGKPKASAKGKTDSSSATTATTSAKIAKSKPLVVLWDGPLVLRPTGRAAKPDRKNYTVSANGKNLKLSSAESTVYCRSFSYDNAKQQGTILGSKDYAKLTGTPLDGEDIPARIVSIDEGDRTEITCGTIKFDQTGTADLTGKGSMRRWASRPAGKTVSTQPEAPQEDVTCSADSADAVAQWSKSVAIRFDTVTLGETAKDAKDAKFDGMLPGQGRKRFVLTEVEFEGDVHFRERKTGDTVGGNKVRLEMKADDGGLRSHLAKAIVTGNASAVRGEQTTNADEITVTFVPKKPDTDSKDANTAEEDKDAEKAESSIAAQFGGKVDPETIEAKGNVRLTDKKGGKDIEATGDRLVADAIKEDATLYGKPGKLATVSSGTDKMSAQMIHMSQKEHVFEANAKGETKKGFLQYVDVDGAGQLDFETDRDLNGVKTDTLTPITITWASKMSFYPKMVNLAASPNQSQATFTGNVKVVTGGSHLHSDKLTVDFRKKPKPAKPAKSTADSTTKSASNGKDATSPKLAEKKSSAGLDSVDYSSFDLVKMDAAGNVNLLGTEVDPQGRILRRMRLEGGKLVYNRDTGRMNVPTAGKMFSEDYRPAKREVKKADKADQADSKKMERPSITVFTWADSMELSQDADGKQGYVADMKGQVLMRHKSGKHAEAMITALKVKTPPWPAGLSVPDGRNSELICDEMYVWFLKPTGPVASGPRVGALELFKATGDVQLTDGTKTITAQRLLYNGRDELLQAWGYRKGHPEGDAMLVDTGDEGESQVTSPSFIWNRRTNTVQTGALSGSGQ